MLTTEFYKKIEDILPESLCCAWDNDGLSVLPEKAHESKKVLIALDITMNVLKYVKENGFDTIVAHHPLIFKPLSNLTGGDAVSERALYAVRENIALMSFHTRLDASVYGIKMFTAKRLGFDTIEPFVFDGEPIGYVGTYSDPVMFDCVLKKVKEITNCPSPMYSSPNKTVKKAVIVCGSFSEGAEGALSVGADTFISGEIKHHAMIDAYDMGIGAIAAGHYHSEIIAVECLGEILKNFDVEISVYPHEGEINYAV